jgi:sec-independent protein translocase protein TatC
MVEDEINDKEMPLLEHLAELRRRLLWAGAAFFVAFGICYYFSADIYSFLAAPLAQVLKASGQKPQLIYTALYEAFFTYLKVSFFSAAFLSFPVVASQLWLFIAPGLYKREKNAMLPFLIVTPVLFFLGGALAYYVIAPFAFKFGLSFEDVAPGSKVQIVLMPKVSDYLNFVIKLIFAFGLSFELPVLMTLLGKVGIVSSAGLKKYRRYAYVGCTIVAAIITPSDPISMCAMAVPLLLLYEISIISVKLVEPKLDLDAKNA